MTEPFKRDRQLENEIRARHIGRTDEETAVSTMIEFGIRGVQIFFPDIQLTARIIEIGAAIAAATQAQRDQLASFPDLEWHELTEAQQKRHGQLHEKMAELGQLAYQNWLDSGQPE